MISEIYMQSRLLMFRCLFSPFNITRFSSVQLVEHIQHACFCVYKEMKMVSIQTVHAHAARAAEKGNEMEKGERQNKRQKEFIGFWG